MDFERSKQNITGKKNMTIELVEKREALTIKQTQVSMTNLAK